MEDSSEGSGGEDLEAAMHVPKHAPSSRISEKKIQERLRRVFQIKADGTYKVPEDLRKDYLNKHTRKKIEALFEKVNFDPDGVFSKVICMFWGIPVFQDERNEIKTHVQRRFRSSQMFVKKFWAHPIFRMNEM